MLQRISMPFLAFMFLSLTAFAKGHNHTHSTNIAAKDNACILKYRAELMSRCARTEPQYQTVVLPDGPCRDGVQVQLEACCVNRSSNSNCMQEAANYKIDGDMALTQSVADDFRAAVRAVSAGDSSAVAPGGARPSDAIDHFPQRGAPVPAAAVGSGSPAVDSGTAQPQNQPDNGRLPADPIDTPQSN